jgi:short-subunit dehydrogenase
MSRSSQPEGPKHVLITGASSGIGAALARHYARPGVMLSLAGRDEERVNGIALECEALRAQAEGAVVDVVDARAVAEWVLRRDALRSVDLVVANAGIGGATAVATPFGEAPEDARLIFNVNMLGVVNTVTPLVPLFAERGRGQIAIMSSLAGLLGIPHTPAYSASKAAAAVYGDALRRLLLPRGVEVCVVYPGYVATPMSDSLPFPRPFLWSVEKAAAHIAKGLAAGRGEIVFPRRLHLAIRLGGILPKRLLDRILAGRAARDLEREKP